MRSILGTWKLVSATARDASGRELPAPYAGRGMGRVTFTAEGRMMSVVCDGRAELPSGVRREYRSYCGAYTFDTTRHPIRAVLAAIRSAACVLMASA